MHALKIGIWLSFSNSLTGSQNSNSDNKISSRRQRRILQNFSFSTFVYKRDKVDAQVEEVEDPGVAEQVRNSLTWSFRTQHLWMLR